MATATVQVLTSFTPANALQPTFSTPAENPIYSGTLDNQVYEGVTFLAAAGVSFTLPVPSNWSSVNSIHIQNKDLIGSCVLTLNATSGAPVFRLDPAGGTFASTLRHTVPAGTVVANPATWTLKSCDSNGVLANGVATYVYIYMTGH